jgi:hypothetical protein
MNNHGSFIKLQWCLVASPWPFQDMKLLGTTNRYEGPALGAMTH